MTEFKIAIMAKPKYFLSMITERILNLATNPLKGGKPAKENEKEEEFPAKEEISS